MTNPKSSMDSPVGPVRRRTAAFGLAVVIVIVLWLVYNMLDKTGGSPMNPYEYDISAFKKVPPEMIGYEEGASFATTLEESTAIAAGDDGRIYVAGDLKIVVFNTDGAPSSSFSIPANSNALAVDAEENIYVGATDRVIVYGKNGSVTEWPSLGENANITSVAIGADDVFVADFDSRLVWRFDKSGSLKGQIGEAQPTVGYPGFLVPSPYFDVALAPDGSLWATNPGKLRVEEHSPDGGFKRSWGGPSMKLEGFCGCCNPMQIAIAPDGSFFTAEKGLPRVKVCSADGTLKTVVAGPEQFDDGTILDFALGEGPRVYVLDRSRNLVRTFTPKPGAETAE
jgi:sugar lactone lactonase YvrE